MERNYAEKQRIYRFFYQRGVHYQLKLLLRMLLPKDAYRYEVDLNVDGGSYVTEGRISIGLFDFLWDCSYDEIYACLRALLSHEVGHLLFGDFKLNCSQIESLSAYLNTKHELSKRHLEAFIKYLLNSLEDGRVEQLMSQQLAGVGEDFQYLRCLWWENLKVTSEEPPISVWQSCVLSLATTGLWPNGFSELLDDPEIQQVQRQIDLIKPYIERAVLAPTLHEFYRYVWELIRLSEPFLVQQLPKESEIESESNNLINLFENLANTLQLPQSEIDNSEIRLTEEEILAIIGGIEEEKGDFSPQIQEKSSSLEENSENEEEVTPHIPEGFLKGDIKVKTKLFHVHLTPPSLSDFDSTTELEENSEENQELTNHRTELAISPHATIYTKVIDTFLEPNVVPLKTNSSPFENESTESPSIEETLSETMTENTSSLETTQSSIMNPQSSQEPMTPLEPTPSPSPQNNPTILSHLQELKNQLAEQNRMELEATEKISQLSESRMNQQQQELEQDEAITNEEIQLVVKRSGYGYDSIQFIPDLSKPITILPEIKNRGHYLKTQLTRILKSSVLEDESYCKRGMVDSQLLWRTALNDDKIFSRKAENNKRSFAISVLVDGSWSMEEYTSYQGKRSTKWKDAIRAAAIIEEGLRGLIPFSVTVFTSECGDVYHYRVKPFSTNPKQNLTWSFFNRYPRPFNSNYDGYSIALASKELEKQPEKEKIMIVLSDGIPCDGNGVQKVHEVVEELRKKHIHVVAIAIGDEAHRRDNKDNYEYMYGKGLVLCEPEYITERLTHVIRTLIK